MNLTLSKTDRTLWSTEQPKTIDHKLNIISELNVISAIQWKSKIVLASTAHDDSSDSSRVLAQFLLGVVDDD